MSEIKDPSDLTKYEGHFNEENFWDKLLKVARKAGVKVSYAAVLLFYTLISEEVEVKHKVIIMGALGYFILPLDLIPDFLPGGYIDDLGALVFALKSVYESITPEIEEKAQMKVKDFFGEVNPADFKLL